MSDLGFRPGTELSLVVITMYDCGILRQRSHKASTTSYSSDYSGRASVIDVEPHHLSNLQWAELAENILLQDSDKDLVSEPALNSSINTTTKVGSHSRVDKEKIICVIRRVQVYHRHTPTYRWPITYYVSLRRTYSIRTKLSWNVYRATVEGHSYRIYCFITFHKSPH